MNRIALLASGLLLASASLAPAGPVGDSSALAVCNDIAAHLNPLGMVNVSLTYPLDQLSAGPAPALEFA